MCWNILFVLISNLLRWDWDWDCSPHHDKLSPPGPQLTCSEASTFTQDLSTWWAKNVPSGILSAEINPAIKSQFSSAVEYLRAVKWLLNGLGLHRPPHTIRYYGTVLCPRLQNQWGYNWMTNTFTLIW